MIVNVSERAKRREKPWNRCDSCGKFIALAAFEIGMAKRRLVSVDTAFSSEKFSTLCPECVQYDE